MIRERQGRQGESEGVVGGVEGDRGSDWEEDRAR